MTTLNRTQATCSLKTTLKEKAFRPQASHSHGRVPEDSLHLGMSALGFRLLVSPGADSEHMFASAGNQLVTPYHTSDESIQGCHTSMREPNCSMKKAGGTELAATEKNVDVAMHRETKLGTEKHVESVA